MIIKISIFLIYLSVIIALCSIAYEIYTIIKIWTYDPNKIIDRSYPKYTETNIMTEEMKFLMKRDSVQVVDDLIDSLIKKAADNYFIFTAGFDPEKYINSSEADVLTKYIKESISYNMTPVIKNIIGTVYDIDTEDKFNTIIDLKIKIYVIAILADKNKPIQ